MTAGSAPIMQIRQSDEDGWKVAATWPDGSSEEIGTFASETDANKWIADKLQEWLDDRKDPQARDERDGARETSEH